MRPREAIMPKAILAACHALAPASGRKVNDDDPTFSVIAFQIGGIGQKRVARTAPPKITSAHAGDC
jgi:hypothetical protein